MTEFGTGEPDIFRANFMGQSVVYYVDKISGSIKFIGEQSLFKINYTLDAHNNITTWTIIDNLGVTYYFNQTETTTNTLPNGNVVPPTSTSAWLLTKAVHPSGDYLQFTYANYGYSVPAFTMQGSVSWTANPPAPAVLSTDYNQNVAIQSPYYLTRVESSDAAVNFTLSTRTDLYGPGSRELTQITVLDKLTGIIKKTSTFNYSYFQSSYNPWASYLGTLSYTLPTPLTTTGYLACSNTRLRLDSVNINLNSYQPPYRFTYNSNVPDKYSYSQDHWGYLNAAGNVSGGYTFTHLIPVSGTGGVGSAIPSTYLSASNLGVSRDCDPIQVQAMILTSVVYPTGGSTSFVYEPHQSNAVAGYTVIGGGVRVKTINNYVSGSLVGSTNYTYSSGKYMGAIEYYTDQAELSTCTGGSNGGAILKYSSSGAVNFNEILIGYAEITISQQSPTGQSNGYLVKAFNLATPSSNYSGGLGFDVDPPAYPSGYNVNGNPQPYSTYLDPANKDLPPTPSANLEGKLFQEQYYDSLNNLIKSVNYYYHLANYTNGFYDIRAVQNRAGGFNYSGSCLTPNIGSLTGGNRPVYLFISPAKSYHTLKDSVVETTYSGNNFIKKKTAYQYNPYYQPMFEISYNSDSTQTIQYTRMSAELAAQSGAPSGVLATQMNQMFNQHLLDLPIEQTVLHRDVAGDSTVISSRFNVYQNALPLQVYNMETAQPLTLRTQFVPWYLIPGTSWSVAIDPHYVLYTSGDYSANNMIWTLHTLQGDKSYIWDENYNELMAQVTNADSVDVAFSSFETAANGRWVYNSSAVAADNTTPTGSNVFGLSASNNISIGGLKTATTYVVSYWSKTESVYTVTGSTAVTQGKTINGWTYFEHTVKNTGSVIVSGTGSIDEVRLYPSTAQMVSYTYSPLIGITSESDVANRITYYFYDSIGRLKWIKDQDGNIVKTFQYHFQSLPGMEY